MLKILINKILKDSLYSNSLYLLASALVLMGTGFLFWTLVARLYTSAQIGAANTVYSLITTVSGLSMLGIASGLIRFLPGSKIAIEKINTAVTLVMATAILAGFIILQFTRLLPPSFKFLEDPLFRNFFVIFCLLMSLNSILESVLLVYRRTKDILFKNTIFGLVKLALPVTLITFGAFGIVASMLAGVLTSLIYSFIVLNISKQIKVRLTVNLKSVRIMGGYSLGTFVASLSANLHSYFLPLFITGTQNVKTTAYFTIATTIASVIFIIPQVVSQSLLVEGAHDEKNVFIHAKKSLLLIMAVLIPLIISIIIFGRFVLNLFGTEYSKAGFAFLRVYSLSGIFVGFNYVFGTVLYIQKRIPLVIILSFSSSLAIILMSLIFRNMGLVGIGYSTLYAQIILTLFYVISLRLWKPAKQLFKPIKRIN